MGVDVEELELLYRGRYPRFLRVALALCDGDRERAHDAVQESFARALKARDGFRGEGSVEAWVWRMVTNVALRERRREQGPAVELPSTEERPGDADWSRLRATIAELPERQRLVVFLRHYADLDYEQIGETIGIARGTVAATLHAAHAALRKAMQEEEVR